MPKLYTVSEVVRLFQMGQLHRSDRVTVRVDGVIKELRVGQVLVIEISGTMVDYQLDKKGCSRLVNEIIDKYSDKEALRRIDLLKTLFYKSSTDYGLSLSLQDCTTEIADEVQAQLAPILEDKSNDMSVGGECMTQLDGIITDGVNKWFETTPADNPLQIMANSGARVTDVQIRQMCVSRGYFKTMVGTITKTPITGSLAKGMDTHGYFRSAGPARSSLYSTSAVVPISGYLTRQLVQLTRELYVTEYDCGTNKGILSATGGVIGRYTTDGRSTDGTDMGLEELRSPITCESNKGLCSLCCGRDLATGEHYHDNTGIGVIAAQSLGETATQSALSAKHKLNSVTAEDYATDHDRLSLPRIYKLLGLRGNSKVNVIKVNEDALVKFSDIVSEYGDNWVLGCTRIVDELDDILATTGSQVSRVMLEVIARAISDITETDSGTIEYRHLGGHKGEHKLRTSANSVLKSPNLLKTLSYGYIGTTLKSLNLHKEVGGKRSINMVASERILANGTMLDKEL
jgi:hypothetical protein